MVGEVHGIQAVLSLDLFIGPSIVQGHLDLDLCRFVLTPRKAGIVIFFCLNRPPSPVRPSSPKLL